MQKRQQIQYTPSQTCISRLKSEFKEKSKNIKKVLLKIRYMTKN